MQALSKGHHETVGSWLFAGLNLKTLVFAAVAVTASYYVQQGRITDRISVTEEKSFATNHRIDELERVYEAKFANQLAALQSIRDTTLRKDTYDRDQLRQADELKDLRDRQRTTDEVLMRHK